MVSSVRYSIPTVIVTELVVVPTMVMVWLTNQTILSAYVSSWVEFSDDWLEPFWSRLRHQCYSVVVDEKVEDDEMMHGAARLYQVQIHPTCPGKECVIHGG